MVCPMPWEVLDGCSFSYASSFTLFIFCSPSCLSLPPFKKKRRLISPFRQKAILHGNRMFNQAFSFSGFVAKPLYERYI
jgi:hypothetical protein